MRRFRAPLIREKTAGFRPCGARNCGASSGAARALIFFPYRARPHEPTGAAPLFKNAKRFSFFSAPRLRRELRGPSGTGAQRSAASAYRPLGEVLAQTILLTIDRDPRDNSDERVEYLRLHRDLFVDGASRAVVVRGSRSQYVSR